MAGVTLVESMVVLGVFSLLVLTFFKSVIMVQDGNTMMGHHNRVNTKCQRVLNHLVTKVSSSVRLYGENSEGRLLLNTLEGVSTEILPDSKLPVLLPDGIVEKDPENERSTGNCLLFIQADTPYGYKAEGGTEDFIRIDVYRIVAVYLKRKPGVVGSLEKRPDGLELAMFKSVPLLDFGQVSAVENDEEKERLLRQARTERGIDYLFDKNEVVSRALRTFDLQGVLNPNLPDPYVILADSEEGQKDILADTSISVATNGAPEQYGVARFAWRSIEGAGFPHGLEARIIGGAGARQILLHLTLVMRSKPTCDLAYADLHSMAVARDY